MMDRRKYFFGHDLYKQHVIYEVICQIVNRDATFPAVAGKSSI